MIHQNYWQIIKDEVETSSVDLVVLDPPYDIYFERYNWDIQGVIDWNDLAKQLFRVLKESKDLVVFTDSDNIDKILTTFTKAGFYSTSLPYWLYENGLNAVRFIKPGGNPDIIYKKMSAEINEITWQYCRTCDEAITQGHEGHNTIKHPSQKPLDVIMQIIHLLTKKDDVVLDCFMGTGTTGEAAKLLSRKFIGVEMNDEYFKIAKKRLR